MQLKTPTTDLIYTFDWTADLDEGIQLVSVAHFVPLPFVLKASAIDITSGLSTVEITGGTHGALGVVRAEATLSSTEVIPGQFTLRCAIS